MCDLRALALEALATERVMTACPEPDYTDAIVSAFEAKQQFMSCLRIATGIDDALWRELTVSILP